ncbi:MAG: carbonate dehydratase [Bacteroidia bacterium]|jgi:carbonic anhydrase
MREAYDKLLSGNKKWSEEKLKQDPDFFKNLTLGQHPEHLWIGCSDSRVPANEITNTKSGEIFVHRNIANMVVHTDFNLMSVLYYAVEVLHVKHIIVCGHYGCGGVAAAMTNKDHGFVNNWLRNIKEVYHKHRTELEAIADLKQRENRLVELNVIEQVQNLGKTRIVQNAWKKQELQVHGWVYGFNNGLITDLHVMMDETNDVQPIFRYEL